MNKVVKRQRRIVGGIGPKDCKIALVGEALGAQEEKIGKPFVGNAGHLLNECLSRAGIIRDDCYITNVIKERPHRNRVKEFIDLSKVRVVETEEYKEYITTLKEELNEVKANVIVALGAVPLWALTEQKGITKRRGSIYESTLLPGRKVIPVIHPAAALRQYMFKSYITLDLKRVLEESYYPTISLPRRKLQLDPTFVECMEYLETTQKKYTRVGYDIEVLNYEVSCISFSVESYSAISIPFVKGGRDYFTPDQEMMIWKKIAGVLENKEITKIAQNGVFDGTFLFNRYGIRVEPVDDTMVASAIAFPDFPKGLDFLTSVNTKEPYYKDEGKERMKKGMQDDRGFWRYNAKDSAVLMEIFPSLYRDLKKLGNTEMYRNQVRLIEPLIFMGNRGIRVDVENIKREGKEVRKRILELEQNIRDETDGVVENPGSSAQVKKYFYVVKDIKPYINRATKKPTVDVRALHRLSRKGHRVADLLLEHRKVSKYHNTYLSVKLDEDDRIRCSFNPVGTVNGRLSSSKTIFKTGMNLQNQPKRMKRFLLADEGYVVYEMDLSQAENRIVAYIAPEMNLIRAFENNIDIHSQTASLLFGKKIADISNEPGSSPLGNGEQSERFWGKTANHALNYGMSWFKYSMSYEVSAKEAKMIIGKYHTAYPGIKRFHNWIRNEMGKTRSLTNLFGRKRMFFDRWGDELLRGAYNYIPQSTVADIINMWGMNYAYYDESFKKMEILNQVHDSIVFQIPIEVGWKEHSRMILDLKQSLEQELTFRGRTFSIPVELEMGLNFKDTKEVTLTNTDTDGLSKRLKETYNSILEVRGNE